MKYRKKPVVIEAVQFTKELRDAIVFDEVKHPAGFHIASAHYNREDRKVWRAECCIETLEGRMNIDIGDWIITGVKGEVYPCKDEIFRLTYEPVTEGLDRESGNE